jgi:KH domain-containing protein
MRTLILSSAKRILRSRKEFEKKLRVKLHIRKERVEIEGSEMDEYLAVSVLDATELGFDMETAFLLLEPDYVLEKVEMRNITRRKNLGEVRARAIGTHGRTKELIEELSDCYISIHDNTVGIIGLPDNIRICIQAVTKLIQGSKQSSVYSYLEKSRGILHPPDLGLKRGEVDLN